MTQTFYLRQVQLVQKNLKEIQCFYIFFCIFCYLSYSNHWKNFVKFPSFCDSEKNCSTVLLNFRFVLTKETLSTKKKRNTQNQITQMNNFWDNNRSKFSAHTKIHRIWYSLLFVQTWWPNRNSLKRNFWFYLYHNIITFTFRVIKNMFSIYLDNVLATHQYLFSIKMSTFH